MVDVTFAHFPTSEAPLPSGANRQLSLDISLLKAAWAGDSLSICSLLASGASALHQNSPPVGDQSSALILAAYKGHADCVRLLLPASNAMAAESSGRNALAWAASEGHDDCVAALIPGGARASGCAGWTPLMLAAYGGWIKSAMLLLPCGSIDALNDHGHNAADCARSRGHLDLASTILAWRAAQTERDALCELASPARRTDRHQGL